MNESIKTGWCQLVTNRLDLESLGPCPNNFPGTAMLGVVDGWAEAWALLKRRPGNNNTSDWPHHVGPAAWEASTLRTATWQERPASNRVELGYEIYLTPLIYYYDILLPSGFPLGTPMQWAGEIWNPAMLTLGQCRVSTSHMGRPPHKLHVTKYSGCSLRTETYLDSNVGTLAHTSKFQ